MASKTSPPIPEPFLVDYAPTGRGSCKQCKALIAQGSVRFGRKVRSPWHDGFDVQYRHFKCGMHYVTRPEEIVGLENLKWNDFESCLKKMGVELELTSPVITMYKERSEALWSAQTTLEKIPLAPLMKVLEANGYESIDRLKAPQAVFLIADGLLFKKPPQCPICDHYTLEQIGSQFRCRGFLEGSSARCQFRYQLANLYEPEKKPDMTESGVDNVEILTRTEQFTLPVECLKIPAFKNWKPLKNVSSENGPSKPKKARIKVEESEEEQEPSVPTNKELTGLCFSSIGLTDPPRQQLISLIEKHGGIFSDAAVTDCSCLLVGNDLTAVKSTKKFIDAIKLGVPVLNSQFVPALLTRTPMLPSGLVAMKGKKRAAPSAAPPSKRRMGSVAPTDIDQENQELTKPKRRYAKYYMMAGKMPPIPFPKIRDCLAKETEREKSTIVVMRPVIDTNSALLEMDNWVEHKPSQRIYVDEFNNAYNAPTIFSDVTTGVNKFYNIQLLEIPGNKPMFNLFRRWGRVGVTKGPANDFMSDHYGTDKEEAIGRLFRDRFDMPPVAGRYQLVHLEGHQDEHAVAVAKTVKTNVKTEVPEVAQKPVESKLHPTLQMLHMMEASLESRNVDIRKMPLGTLSRRQMNEAYRILQTLQNLLLGPNKSEDGAAGELPGITIGSPKWKAKIIAATNAFYTTIPHQFSLKETPPLLDSAIKLKSKIEMMEQLMEISVANTIMEDSLANSVSKATHIVDQYYDGLSCIITPVEENDPIYNALKMGLKNTHGSTHTGFQMSVMDIFRCERCGEKDRYVNFLKEHNVENRRLLWHGSRLTNWAGILKLGLRIAPKEAPVSGYMFGKGASKSSQYCFADSSNPYGLLVISEVALGNPYVRLEAQESAKATCKKQDCHHTWGVGRTAPDPTKVYNFTSVADGANVPLVIGKGVGTESFIEVMKKSNPKMGTPHLLYNEFIVYSDEQVLLSYIIKVKFDFKSCVEEPPSSDSSSDSD